MVVGGSTLVYIHVLYCHKRFNQYSAHKKDVAIFFSLNSQTYSCISPIKKAINSRV